MQVCFDLARSIDLHQVSTAATGEKAIAGRTSGLITLHETVTWRAKHLGVTQELTSVISHMEYPHTFTDEQVKGAFAFFRHEHHFLPQGNGTLMTDTFTFKAPLGILGSIASWLFLTRYMERFLHSRNEEIRRCAESDDWKKYVENPQATTHDRI